jgi:hypothetical protein
MTSKKQTKTFADRIIDFNQTLHFEGELPAGINIMNPYQESDLALKASSTFYKKYYSDTHPRHLILGINPGRFGSAMTGVSFTDPKRLITYCDIPFPGKMTHEPSSEFIYEMITAYGGPEAFYKQFYISSVCPLGFTITGEQGRVTNYNYYDNKALMEAAYPFIITQMERQLALGFETDIAYCFGTGKNENFLRKLNAEKKYFGKIIALPHPRYIMQYKSKMKTTFVDEYLEAFKEIKRDNLNG